MGFVIIFGLAFFALIGGLIFKVWRVVTFAKLMKVSYWKAFWLLGK